MKKIVIILALILVLGAVFISGCTTTQNNTIGNSNVQNKSSGIPGYSTAQIVNIGSGDVISKDNIYSLIC